MNNEYGLIYLFFKNKFITVRIQFDLAKSFSITIVNDSKNMMTCFHNKVFWLYYFYIDSFLVYHNRLPLY